MKRKKTIIMLVALLAVLAVTLLAVTLLPQEKKDTEPREDSLGLDTQSLTSLTLEDMTFEKEGENWVYAGDEAFPLDQEKITDMLEALSSISLTKTIEQPASLKSYGLDTPQCTVWAGDWTLKIGNDRAMNAGRYFSIGDGNVYITGQDILSPFRYTLLELVDMETAPRMQTLSYVCLERQGEDTLLLENQQGEGLSYSPEYIWFRNGQALDTEKTETLIRRGTDMLWQGCAAYRVENLAVYGLDTPTLRMTIGYESGTYILEVGTAVSGKYYARMNGTGCVYWMDATDVNALLEADPGDLYPGEVLMMDWDTVQSVTAELAGESWQFTAASRQKQSQEAAETVQEGEQETYWLESGREVALAAVLESLTDMEPTASAQGLQPERSLELCLTICRSQWPDLVVCFYRHTTQESLVTLDGEPMVKVSRKDAVALAEAITALVLAE